MQRSNNKVDEKLHTSCLPKIAQQMDNKRHNRDIGKKRYRAGYENMLKNDIHRSTLTPRHESAPISYETWP